MRRRCLEESPWRSVRDGSSQRSTRRRWFGWSGTEARRSGRSSRDLDLTATAVRHWVKQAGVDAGGGGAGALTTAERAELVALRREARQLRMEREILKKAAAFFAKESQ